MKPVPPKPEHTYFSRELLDQRNELEAEEKFVDE